MSTILKASSSTDVLRMLTYNKSSEKLGIDSKDLLKDSIAKRNALIDVIFEKPKKFSRKTMLGGKISSMKETVRPMPGLFNDSTDSKRSAKSRKRKVSLNIKNKITLSFRNCLPQCSINKDSEQSTGDLMNSDEAKSTEKIVRSRDTYGTKHEYLSVNKAPRLNNLLDCLSTDKKLQDNRQQLRVI